MSKPLSRELAGQRSARRGSYRVIFAVDDDRHLIEILHISHRAHACRT
ncbi:MAG: type II toxin-antitoxin system RelE/ParE family toxin [Intrasporangium sp.]|nr:type II toxin-antitoxin system RelE/ParE family toxin [Intrasporangium sp.]MDN5797677.1 type II toxin-antitoxin system RelE/ParE family toxin [Intrasporangium sp.]